MCVVDCCLLCDVVWFVVCVFPVMLFVMVCVRVEVSACFVCDVLCEAA